MCTLALVLNRNNKRSKPKSKEQRQPKPNQLLSTPKKKFKWLKRLTVKPKQNQTQRLIHVTIKITEETETKKEAIKTPEIIQK